MLDSLSALWQCQRQKMLQGVFQFWLWLSSFPTQILLMSHTFFTKNAEVLLAFVFMKIIYLSVFPGIPVIILQLSKPQQVKQPYCFLCHPLLFLALHNTFHSFNSDASCHSFFPTSFPPPLQSAPLEGCPNSFQDWQLSRTSVEHNESSSILCRDW